jgi:hypothetical protein
VTVLDSVPDIELLEYLPEFLDGLFKMLSDNEQVQAIHISLCPSRHAGSSPRSSLDG